MIREGNFIVIQSFMVTELGLKGNELLIYAIIYGFSQDEGQRFTGSIQYLAEWTNMTKRSVLNILQSLVDKGLLQREEKFVNKIKFVEYWHTDISLVVKNFHWGGEKISLGGEKNSLGVVKNFHWGGEKISPNNINNNINNTIDNNIDNNIDNIYIAGESPRMTDQKPKSKSESKHKHGEFKHVLLKDSEYTKLTNEFGEAMRDECITFLDEYIEMKGYKAKSHYLCIRKWVLDAVKEKQKRQNNKIGKVQNRLSWIDNITI